MTVHSFSSLFFPTQATDKYVVVYDNGSILLNISELTSKKILQ